MGWGSRPTRLERLAAPFAGEATRPDFGKKSFTGALEGAAQDVQRVNAGVGPGAGDLLAESASAMDHLHVVDPTLGVVCPGVDAHEDHVPFGWHDEVGEVGDRVLGVERHDMKSQRCGPGVDPDEGGSRIAAMQNEVGEWDEEIGGREHGTTLRDERRPRMHAARDFSLTRGSDSLRFEFFFPFAIFR